jgi:formylglycine-generating enzyme required for sulfatase activity
MSESEFVALGADTGMAPPLREEDVLRRVWWSGPAPPEEASAAPVVGVTWDDAAAYCEWAGLRLPSTSEWELACRGPERFVYPWGNDFDSSRCGRGLDSVWSFLPSQSVCGAVGMCGPINEWCASATGATAESEVAQAPIRGLGWVSYRVAYLWPAGAAVPGGLPCVPWREDAMFPSRWTIDTGFRVAWTCPSGTG